MTATAVPIAEDMTSLVELAAWASRLLDHNRDLTNRATMTTLWPGEPCLSVQLAPVYASLVDLEAWTHRYGAVLKAVTRDDPQTGRPFRDCSIWFEVDGHQAEIYAQVPLDVCRRGQTILDIP